MNFAQLHERIERKEENGKGNVTHARRVPFFSVRDISAENHPVALGVGVVINIESNQIKSDLRQA